MRFHTSLTRAQRVSRKLLKLVRANAAPNVSLGQAQAAVAAAYGYKDWSELKHVATIDPRRSAWDEELPASDVEARRARQAQAFQDSLGLSPVPAMILASTLQITSSNRKRGIQALPGGYAYGAIEDNGTTHLYATAPSTRPTAYLAIMSIGPNGEISGVRGSTDNPAISRDEILAKAVQGSFHTLPQVLIDFEVSPGRGFLFIERFAEVGIPADTARQWIDGFASELREAISPDRRYLLELQGSRGPLAATRERMGLSTKPDSGLASLSPTGTSNLAAAARMIPAIQRRAVRSSAALQAAEDGREPDQVLRAFFMDELRGQPDEPRETFIQDLMGCEHRNTLAAVKVGCALDARWVPRRDSSHWEPFLDISECLLRLADLSQRHPNDLFEEAGGDWTSYLASFDQITHQTKSHTSTTQRDFVAFVMNDMAFEFERAVVRPILRKEGIDLGDRVVPSSSWHRRLPYLFAMGSGSEILALGAEWSNYDVRPDVAFLTGTDPDEIVDLNPNVSLKPYRGDYYWLDWTAFGGPPAKTPEEMSHIVEKEVVRTARVPGVRCLEIVGHDVEGTLRNWEPFLPAGYPRSLDELGKRWVAKYRAWERYEVEFEAKMRAKGL